MSAPTPTHAHSLNAQSPISRKEVVVLGAGVVGLTSALKLQQTGKYNVTILAEVLPGDPKSIRYTSRWAGAHHVYNPLNETAQHSYEEETFNTMWEMSASGTDTEECFLRIPQTEFFLGERAVSSLGPDPFEKMPNYRALNEKELIPSAKSGAAFTTISIDVPIYLNHLLTKFLSLGGRTVRGSLIHLNQLLEGGLGLFPAGTNHTALPDALINCTGLGARFLGGVEDKDVYPVRGQTVLIRAPWVRSGRTEYYEDGRITYIIPRRSSDVIVGGTRQENDWFPRPRQETTDDILERGLKLCPELAPPEARANGRVPTVQDVLPHVVGEGCGLRPVRKGGVRVETEWVSGNKVGREGNIPIIHNYGHGGFGYQASWGCASRVLDLLEKALDPEKKQPPKHSQ